MFTDIVGSVDLKRRLGDAVVAKLIRRHDELFRYTVGAFPFAQILKDLGDGYLASFSSASDAVHAALHFQNVLHHEKWVGEKLQVRIGVHLGEVSELEVEPTSGRAKLSGLAVDITARVMGVALPGQIVMTRAAFDNARQYVREQGTADGETPAPTRRWIAHGRYLFKGAEEAIEIFEVGEIGIAPLAVPPDSEKARRAVAADQEETLGWRPAVGMAVPDRKNWVLDRKLGEGGFGEVWLGEHTKTHIRRVFKFCFDAERLRSFKRELMLFRLLRDALGDRNDIAKLHEVQVEHAPFYLESEFTEDGSLVDWSAQQGGIDKVPLATRIDLVARTAVAVAAAHSVGVLHKDIKPSNILIYRSNDGEPMPRLTDFGIGQLTDPSKLADGKFMMTGMSDSLMTDSDASHTGTRIYAPPEALVGKPFTMQGDVYGLGILLYQMVVADLERPLAQGWEREIADPLLREDIAACVEGHESQRLASAKELADRLQSLAARRRSRRRKQVTRASLAATVILALMFSIAAIWLVRERGMRLKTEQEARKAQEALGFVKELFISIDPRDKGGRDMKVIDLLYPAVERLNAGELADPEVDAAIRSLLGNAFRGLSTLNTAEELLFKTLETRQRTLESPNALLADSLEDYGAIKFAQSLYDDAEKYFRESLRHRMELFGAESLPVAGSLNYLAAARDALGFQPEAEKMYREALELRRKLATGENRVLIARSLNNLATCLQKQHNYDEAERNFKEAVQIITELHGPDHWDVGNGLTRLGSLYRERKQPGDLEKAEQMLRDALRIKLSVHGPQHATVANTQEHMASLYLEKSDWVAAEGLARASLDIRRVQLREDHPSTIFSLDLLVKALEAQQKYALAEPLLLEIQQSQHRTLTAGDWRIGDCSSRIGENLLRQGRVEDAETFLRSGYSELKSSEEPAAAGAASAAAQRLLEYLRTTNKPDEARSLEVELAQRSGK